jgi:hypothetical protein
MDILTAQEIDQIVSTSELVSKYNTEIDRESAYEILNDKILEAEDDEHQLEMEKQREKLRKSIPQRQEKSTFEKVMGSPATRQIGSTIAREMVRGLMGVMGVKFPSGRGRGGLFS